MATIVSTIYEIKDVFDQMDWNAIELYYSCTICTELIYKQEWYQCSDGHTGCGKCWNKIIDKAKNVRKIPLCPLCKKELKDFKESLSRCRFIEQNFNNLKVSCPYSFNQSIINRRENGSKLVRDIEHGCKEIITVEQLDNHQKNCNSRFVKCNNDGCSNISRYNQHQQHRNECGYAIIQCELCKTGIKRSSLFNHLNECPSRIIICNHCPLKLKRSELQYHITNQCPNITIQCRYQAYGCNTQFKRSETSNHLQKINHTELMMKQIDQQSDKIIQYSDKLAQLSDKLLQLTQQVNQQSKQLNEHTFKLNQEKESSNYKFNNLVSYNNTWIISNFIIKNTERKSMCPFSIPASVSIISPTLDVSSYQFKLATGFKNGYQHYYLNVIGSSFGKVKVKYSFKLLNCKDTLKSLTENIEHDFQLNDDGSSWKNCGAFDVQYSKESGYIFPDDSVHIEFRIDVPKVALQS